MFSPSLEIVLHIAFREAVSRRHAYLTLEHLLYAARARPRRRTDSRRLRRGPAGAAARPRARTSTSRSSASAREADQEPEQTTAFRRVLQTAILHVQSAQRERSERRRHPRGDPPAAEELCRAVARRAGRHAARRAQVHLARHLEDAAGKRRRCAALRPAAGAKTSGPATPAIRCPRTA